MVLLLMLEKKGGQFCMCYKWLSCMYQRCSRRLLSSCHTRTVLSSPPVRRRLPLGSNATVLMGALVLESSSWIKEASLQAAAYRIRVKAL